MGNGKQEIGPYSRNFALTTFHMTIKIIFSGQLKINLMRSTIRTLFEYKYTITVPT
jgi:hypothetical protein